MGHHRLKCSDVSPFLQQFMENASHNHWVTPIFNFPINLCTPALKFRTLCWCKLITSMFRMRRRRRYYLDPLLLDIFFQVCQFERWPNMIAHHLKISKMYPIFQVTGLWFMNWARHALFEFEIKLLINQLILMLEPSLSAISQLDVGWFFQKKVCFSMKVSSNQFWR